MMDEITAGIGIAPLLARFRSLGGVIDYVFLKVDEELSPELIHRKAALCGMAVIAGPKWEPGDEIRWDETKLVGANISLPILSDTDVVVPTGYKSAFFDPPYTLRGSPKEQAELFSVINRYVFGAEPRQAEVFSWSTDWSDYFDAGHEWWGAFYWTVRSHGTNYIAVIGVSSTD